MLFTDEQLEKIAKTRRRAVAEFEESVLKKVRTVAELQGNYQSL
jgi:hypothetical protein